MTMRERRAESLDVQPATPMEADTTSSNESREAGDAFLLAADEAIERALSGSSEAFLAQNRQMGGQ